MANKKKGLTIKQFCEMTLRDKRQVQRVCKDFDNKKYLLPEISSVERNTDIHGTDYYTIILAKVKKSSK